MKGDDSTSLFCKFFKGISNPHCLSICKLVSIKKKWTTNLKLKLINKILINANK